jgi:hypothetical protein
MLLYVPVFLLVGWLLFITKTSHSNSLYELHGFQTVKENCERLTLAV